VNRLIALAALAVFHLPTAYAEDNTRYVTDQLEIPMRAGKTNEYRIVRMVKSGTPVIIVESDDSGNALIRTENGQQGWVLSRFLMDQPIDRDRLKLAEQKAANLDVRSTQVREENAQLTQQVAQLQTSNQELVSTNHRLQQEVTEIRGSDASKLREENLKLVADLANLRQNYEESQQQNARLRDRSNHEMMLLGAMLLLLGGIMGIIVPKIRWQKKSGWNSF
jgi:SH3 domain protein